MIRAAWPKLSDALAVIALPALALVAALTIGGLLILASGHEPIAAYTAIVEGTGVTWLSPWLESAARTSAERNLQQTLLLSAPLMLAGVAVAYPLRAGLFNIGGQGQYIVGLIVAVAVGTRFTDVPGPFLMLIGIVLASLAGAAWAAIAGVLRARWQAHEVISTIMLNWVAIFGARWLLERGGPLQGANTDAPRSNLVVEGARIPAIWGDLQPLHAGFLVALVAIPIFGLILTRTQFGFRTRVVGANPEAARYSGIPVGRTIVLAMAIGGGGAGLAGGLDLLGRKLQLASTDVETTSAVAFTGIAVALLGRGRPIGILAAALLFAALIVGTSTRNLDAEVFPPELAASLATVLQSIVILFVGAVGGLQLGHRSLRPPRSKRVSSPEGSPP